MRASIVIVRAATGDARLGRIVEDVVARARRHLQPRRVWLFGSQARGTARHGSDVDFAFQIPQDRKPSWPRFVAEALDEVPALADLDLLDLADCDERLVREIETTGRIVYEALP